MSRRKSTPDGKIPYLPHLEPHHHHEYHARQVIISEGHRNQLHQQDSTADAPFPRLALMKPPLLRTLGGIALLLSIVALAEFIVTVRHFGNLARLQETRLEQRAFPEGDKDPNHDRRRTRLEKRITQR